MSSADARLAVDVDSRLVLRSRLGALDADTPVRGPIPRHRGLRDRQCCLAVHSARFTLLPTEPSVGRQCLRAHVRRLSSSRRSARRPVRPATYAPYRPRRVRGDVSDGWTVPIGLAARRRSTRARYGCRNDGAGGSFRTDHEFSRGKGPQHRTWGMGSYERNSGRLGCLPGRRLLPGTWMAMGVLCQPANMRLGRNTAPSSLLANDHGRTDKARPLRRARCHARDREHAAARVLAHPSTGRRLGSAQTIFTLIGAALLIAGFVANELRSSNP